jgi:DNA primase
MADKHDLDFAYVREHADFATVLAHYGIEPIGNVPQLKAHCPFHDDKKPSLAVNTQKNIFNCFACDAKGNILDFVMMKEDLKPRPAGIKLAKICGIAQTANGKAIGAKTTKNKSVPVEAEESGENVAAEAQSGDEDAAAENKPLTFELKLDTEAYHPWLESRGISPDRAETFGIGLATKGVMKDRLAIPIHNEKGELVAYCGRYPADEVPGEEPKYKLPPGFRKDLELFNLHRSPVGKRGLLMVVESYLSVIKHWGSDTPIVSPMGRSISSQQVDKLVDHGVKRVAILFDGDDPGRQGAKQVAGAIASAGMWAKIGNIPDGRKPHQMSYEEVLACFDS